MPPLYRKWFQRKWPTHPSLKHPSSTLVLQTLNQLQGTKDSAYEWHRLIHSFFTKHMHMTCLTSSKGIYIWDTNSTRSYLALATDDFLLSTSNATLYTTLQDELSSYFTFTHSSGPSLSFLNLRLLQSKHAISIDQTENIETNILKQYWGQYYTKGDIRFYADPFPIDMKFEQTLFQAFPLSGYDLLNITKQYNGSISHWVGELIYISTHTRFDIAYATMRIGAFMDCPKLPIFQALHQLMSYLYHHPHLPIIYSRTTLSNTSLTTSA